MTRPTLVLLLSLVAFTAFGQKSLAGEYKTNFSTYGMFEKTLILNCDSTIALNFRGDMMNDNSYGRWDANGKILVLIFDTIKSVNSRYKRTMYFQVKSKRLYQTVWVKEFYQKTNNEYGKETIKDDVLPKPGDSNKQHNQAMKNYTGKTGVQFFKRVKAYKCGE